MLTLLDYLKDLTVLSVRCMSSMDMKNCRLFYQRSDVIGISINGRVVNEPKIFDIPRLESTLEISVSGKMLAEELRIVAESSLGHVHSAFLKIEQKLPFSVKQETEIQGTVPVQVLLLESGEPIEIFSVQTVDKEHNMVEIPVYSGTYAKGCVSMVIVHPVEAPIWFVRITMGSGGVKGEEIDVEIENNEDIASVECHVEGPILLRRPVKMMIRCVVMEPNRPVSYAVEKDAAARDWVIGGKAEGLICHDNAAIPLVMMALRPGCIALPSIRLDYQGPEPYHKTYVKGHFVEVHRTSG